MRKFILFILGIGCCYFENTYSNTRHQNLNNFSTGIGSPIVTSTTATLDKHSWSVNERIEYYRSHPISDAVLLHSTDFESLTGEMINYFMMSYGLFDNFTVGANLPMQHSYNLRGAKAIDGSDTLRAMHLGNISGIADSTIYSMWRITKEDENKLQTALLIGLTLPTGKTTVRTLQGELFGSSDQPGTGAWIPMAGVIFSKDVGNLSLSANLFYSQTTKGSQDTTLGSFFDYSFASTYPLYEHKGRINYLINGVLEVVGEYWGKDKIHGIKTPDTGGNSIYLNPGLRATIKDFSCYLSVGIPIAEKLNGTQATSHYALYAGIDLSL